MEPVIAVGIKYPDITPQQLKSSMEELSCLIKTVGGTVVENIIQKRQKPNPAFLIGKGKAEEISSIIQQKNIKTVIFNEELNPTQQHNLEDVIPAKIIDRTRLILDIFAKRARTKEGSLQVELAQLNYYLPRLTKKGISLDNQVGGIGTRGPGERKLEYDRRKIRDRISKLEKEIDNLKVIREIQRTKRIDSGLPVISLIGYTNVGKSTLLNTLIEFTKQNTKKVYADDKLFATLDPTVRRVILPSGRTVLFVDTVGFIRKLPATLINAFRATLEEINKSKILIHLIDITSHNYEFQENIVIQTLKEIKIDNIPVIKVYNKCDLIDEVQYNKFKSNNTLLISAKTGKGIKELLDYIDCFQQ